MVGPGSPAVASEWFSLPSHAALPPGSVPAIQAGLRRHLGCSAHLAGIRRWHGPGRGALLATHSSFTSPSRPPGVRG
eukprot:9476955-Pyramimonas_sp.AAC.2